MYKINIRCILLVLCLVQFSYGLYFLMGEKSRKCFIEDLSDENVIVTYKIEVFDPQTRNFLPSPAGKGMFVEVRDQDDEIILSRMYSLEGQIAFTSNEPGEHQICMFSNSSTWFGNSQFRVYIDITKGPTISDYTNLAKDEKLTATQLHIRQILDQVKKLTKSYVYQRYQERRFRRTSESTNSKVLWWSLMQMVVLVTMGFWQMRHLKSFFEAKKLV